MPKTLRPYDPDQMLLMPPSVRDWVPREDLAHFVSDVVDEVDLSATEDVYQEEQRGCPPYHPRGDGQAVGMAYGVLASVADLAVLVLVAGDLLSSKMTISDAAKDGMATRGRIVPLG